jgi:oligopeptide/dipeptide ABC transporter ATP-binding protein
VLADEPTTALDVTVQAEVLAIFRSIVQHTGTSVVLVTHDLGVVAEACDDVLVMYAGRVVEHAPVRELFANPRHPYTRALLACLPRAAEGRQERLDVIPGQPPNAMNLPAGCAFAPRCPHAEQACETRPALRPVGTEHVVACHRVGAA